MTSPAAKRTTRDDRLALATIALGAAIAFLGIRVPVMLASGVALGVAGVLLAIRGERAIVAARALTLALVVAVVTAAAYAALGIYQEWIVGQRLAEGASADYVMAAMRPYARGRVALRSIALFSSLSMLLGAVVTRVSTASSISGK